METTNDNNAKAAAAATDQAFAHIAARSFLELGYDDTACEIVHIIDIREFRKAKATPTDSPIATPPDAPSIVERHKVIGEILHRNGYRNVDALVIFGDHQDKLQKSPQDPASASVAALRLNNYYRNIYQHFAKDEEEEAAEEEKEFPLKRRYYEVAICAYDCESAPRSKSFAPIMRHIQSNGVICWSMTANIGAFDRDGTFERQVATLCDRCRWISVLGYPKTISGYDGANQSGLFYAMQVI